MTGTLARRSPPEELARSKAQRWMGFMDGSRFLVCGIESRHRWDWAVPPSARASSAGEGALCGVAQVPCLSACSWERGGTCFLSGLRTLVTACFLQLLSFSLLASSVKQHSLSWFASDFFQIPFKHLTTGMKCGLES